MTKASGEVPCRSTARASPLASSALDWPAAGHAGRVCGTDAHGTGDLNALWYDTKGTWDAVHAQAKELDELINEFNEATGLLKAL